MERHWSSAVISGSLLVMMAGCAGHQKLAVEYRLSKPTPVGEQNVGNLLETGKTQLDAGLYSMALESFRSVLRQSPDSAPAYNGLAIAYDRIGRADLAQRYFETAIAKAPHDARYRTNLAQLFTNTGRANLAAALTMSEHIEALASFEPGSLTGTNLAKPEPLDLAVSLEESNLPVVEMAITLAPMELPHFKVEVSPLLAPKITEAKLIPADNEAHFAILPVRKIQVLKAYVQPEAPGPQAPSAPEPNRNPLNFGGTFAGAQFSPRRNGVRMERSSLGEVQLVTLNDGFEPEPKQASFSSFENRLASWLPDAISREQTSTAPLQSGSSAILAAIERAQIELAFEQVEQPNSAIAKFESSQFVYHFFHDSEDAVV
jgi:Tetratricopeptide repeat